LTIRLQLTKQQRKGRRMYQQQIEAYLTHYQPTLKAELIAQQSLPAYLESQAAAMVAARQRILEQLQASEPHLSQLQREMEAEQVVRELFLP
jgi:hypothetical protein